MHDTNTERAAYDEITKVNKRLDECLKEIANLKARLSADDTNLQEFGFNTLNRMNAGDSVKPYYVKPY